jgi:HPt (histidine-containing phosphotransfer) domain-containing protein
VIDQRLPVDVASLMERCDHEFDLVAEMLRLFGEQSRRLMNELREHLSRGRVDQAARIAHTIKGSAANLSAEQVRQIAGEMEACLSRGEIKPGSALVDPLAAAREACFIAEAAILGAARRLPPHPQRRSLG